MSILQYGFMQRAFLVGILLAVITPCIGITIVLKRMSMIGDALSHSSLAGVVLGLILGVNPVDGAVVISVLVLAAVLFFYRELFYIGFDENAARISGVSVRNINFLFTILTALTVSIASRTVGTLIVSSMLVVPVACGMQMAKSYKGTLICAIIVAVCTTIAGLFLSYYAGLKPGGMIVLLEVAWFVVVMTVKSFNK